MKKLLALGAALLAACGVAHAFGGEDPINGNPWHHEMISKDAAQSDALGDSKWTPEAAAAIAWHADYVDSYLYNPLWWAASVPDSGIKRFKASRSVEAQLKALHFDDLFSTDKVNMMWRRYASGTFAGLMWAAQHDDVAAGQNVLGASLHSIQDFYSHSNWVDDPARRNLSFFEFPLDKRAATPLWTGSYELPTQMSVKSHGKYLYSAALFKRPGVEQVMEAACSVFSPLAGSDICEDYKLSKTGVSVRPTIDTKLFGNVKVPDNVLVLAPPGIALDNTWIAEVGVKQRGLNDMTGEQGFQTARALAVKQTVQWLQTMEKAMTKAGQGEFWKKMRTTPADDATRFAQYEQFNRFPFLFLGAGPYPPVSSAEEWYLRIRLKTGDDGGAGTDSDIKLRVQGQPDQTLDWMPKANPILAHNDFEKGDDEIYIAGPYAQPPTQIEFYNDSANTGELLGASWRAVKDSVETAVNVIPNIVKGVLGTSADHIKTEHRVWMPDEIAQIPTAEQAPGKVVKILGQTITLPAGQDFSMDFNGGDEGHYIVRGKLLKVGETEEARSIAVRLTELECVKESKWDRGSNSDEPFLVGAVSPFPGDTIPFLGEIFDDVDTGEKRGMNVLFRPVSIPKSAGMLNVAIGVFEHDDESQKTREQLRDKFVGKIDEETENEKRDLLTVIGAYTAADWQLGRIEVDAWSRNGRVKVGNMLARDANVWVKGKKSVQFPLSMKDVVDTGITTDELLPYLPPAGTPTEPNTGTTPPTTMPPTTTPPVEATPGSAADLDKWTGLWQTDKGELNLRREGNVLRGQMRRYDSFQHTFVNAETIELRGVGDGLGVEGTWKLDATTGGTLRWTLKEDLQSGQHPGVAEFGGQYTIGAKPELNPWNGWRPQNAPGTTQPGTGTVPPLGNTGNSTGTIPPISNPGTGTSTIPPLGNTGNNGNGGVVPTPNAGTGATGGDGFRPLDKLDFRVDETRIGRDGTTLELLTTFRNPGDAPIGLTAGGYQLIVTDADGVGFAYRGDLYRAGNAAPEKFDGTPIALPNAALPLRFVFDVPKGVAPLQFMTIRTHGSEPLRFDLKNVNWPSAIAPFSSTGLKNGGAGFQPFGADFDARFDGWKKARDGAYEAFVTFKNTSEKLVGLSTSTYKVFLESADGIAVRDDGNIYRANGERAERIAHSILVEPNVETHIRLRFANKTRPTKFSLKENYGDTLLEWPLTP